MDYSSYISNAIRRELDKYPKDREEIKEDLFLWLQNHPFLEPFTENNYESHKIHNKEALDNVLISLSNTNRFFETLYCSNLKGYRHSHDILNKILSNSVVQVNYGPARNHHHFLGDILKHEYFVTSVAEQNEGQQGQQMTLEVMSPIGPLSMLNLVRYHHGVDERGRDIRSYHVQTVSTIMSCRYEGLATMLYDELAEIINEENAVLVRGMPMGDEDGYLRRTKNLERLHPYMIVVNHDQRWMMRGYPRALRDAPTWKVFKHYEKESGVDFAMAMLECTTYEGVMDIWNAILELEQAGKY